MIFLHSFAFLKLFFLESKDCFRENTLTVNFSNFS
ncbi:hypothetical protein NEOC65_000993 [Neochlamydia sp. AcF65]|nr:hypothetical protein [Neochlamydia sp. AcF65]MBS4170562.1 hypothetical protein [Neochlamydia sp. AcF95]